MAKDIDYQQISKGFLNALKVWGDVQAQRAKITAAVLENDIKASNNLIFKLMEKNYQTPYQRNMMQSLNTIQGQGGGLGNEEVFGTTPQPEVRYGSNAPVIHYPTTKEWFFKRIQEKIKRNIPHPTTKEWFFKRIQEKIKRNIPLTKKEQDFEKSYLGKTNIQDTELFKEDNNIAIPPETTNASEAIQHLKDNYNMDDEQAEYWIRSNYNFS